MPWSLSFQLHSSPKLSVLCTCCWGSCVLAGGKVVTDTYQEPSGSMLGMLLLSGMEKELHRNSFTVGLLDISDL